MSESFCDCKVRAAFPARSLRSGRVLHHNVHGVVILIRSNAPKTWQVLVGSTTGWRTARFSASSASYYHIPDSEVFETIPCPAEGWEDFAATIVALSDEVRGNEAVAIAKEISGYTVKEGYTPRAKKETVSAEFVAPNPNPSRYWYESDRDARFLKDFVSLRRAGFDTNLIITGPSGFGKTEGIIRLGERLGAPVHVVNCQAITTPEKWLGQMQADPERGTYFEISNHLQWVERTHDDCKNHDFCIILYDEITRLRPELGNMTFSLWDGQHGLEVPQMGRRVMMDPNNIIVATANMGSAYTGAFQMDWALRGRFDLTLERGMPPESEELKVLTTATGINDEDGKSLLRVANHTRTLWMNDELDSPISTRSLLSWARMVAGGYTIKEAADYTVIPMYSEDGGAESDRAKVKMAIDGKVSS